MEKKLVTIYLLEKSAVTNLKNQGKVSKKHPSSDTKNVMKTVMVSVCNYICENKERANKILESKKLYG